MKQRRLNKEEKAAVLQRRGAGEKLLTIAMDFKVTIASISALCKKHGVGQRKPR